MSTVIGIGIALGLVGLGVLAIVGAGVKNLVSGEQDYKKIGIFLIPFVVFAVSFGIAGKAADAGIATMLFMAAAMILTIILSGFRSTFNL